MKRAPIIADLIRNIGYCTKCGRHQFIDHPDGIQCIGCSEIYYEFEPPEYVPEKEEGSHIFKLRLNA